MTAPAMTAPARITIELDPPQGRRGRWVTRTVGVESAEASAAAPPYLAASLFPSEPREPEVVPAAYEPADCTCHDGWCDRDHANE